MGELVNVVVAFVVIAFALRYITKGRNESGSANGGRSPAAVLGFRPHRVTEDMMTSLTTMFPDIPADNLRYDLLRTGSVEVTTNKILEKGFLDAPPSNYFELYPRASTPETETAHRPGPSSASTSRKPQQTLISRYSLESRVPFSTTPNVSNDNAMVDLSDAPSVDVKGSSKGVWESDAAKREANLRERKAKMILAARQRLLEQDKKKAETSSPVPGSSKSVS